MGEKKSKVEARSTRVYMENVMQKVFHRNVDDHLSKLLAGDRETFDRCAAFLAKNLDYFQLLHTLCLVTGTRFDLEKSDPIKAADAWVCWWQENKDRIVWDAEAERWKTPNREG